MTVVFLVCCFNLSQVSNNSLVFHHVIIDGLKSYHCMYCSFAFISQFVNLSVTWCVCVFSISLFSASLRYS